MRMSIPKHTRVVKSPGSAIFQKYGTQNGQEQFGNFSNQGNSSEIPSFLIQPKLTISHPNDPYEQEAERVADQVMRMPDPDATIQRAPLGIQRCSKCAAATRIEDMCPSCAAKALQRQEGLIQRAERGAVPEVTPQVETQINALRGGGQPLDGGVRAFMEPRFGHDFSQVRVHTGTQAAQSAADMGALAYTVGRDVVFGAGQYQPGTNAGKRLIAHELTHVVQQGNNLNNSLSRSIQRQPEYPLATRFEGANQNNYQHYQGTVTQTLRPIRRIVIHITDGNANINSTIGWFQNPNQTDGKGKTIRASAHYVVGQDGEVVQMVHHNDIAYHATSANNDSIGIEHVARVARKIPGMDPTPIQYENSAALVRWLCEQYNIPMDRTHIIGHAQAAKTTHQDCPNAVWDWKYYMRLVTTGFSAEPPLICENVLESRAAKLTNDFYDCIQLKRWGEAAVILNGFSNSDIRDKLKTLNSRELELLRNGALEFMPGWSDRIVKPIEKIAAQ
jgi:N-acetyl-anhydromuramyl-L-alanine amidase AmpD